MILPLKIVIYKTVSSQYDTFWTLGKDISSMIGDPE